jgi:hypothetical protein
MVADGTLRKGGTHREWLLDYCFHMREIAAGRSGTIPRGERLDLAHERAALAKEQRVKVAMENAEARHELIAQHEVRDVMLTVGAELASALDSAPARIIGAMGVSGEIAAKAKNAAETEIRSIRRSLTDRLRQFAERHFGSSEPDRAISGSNGSAMGGRKPRATGRASRTRTVAKRKGAVHDSFGR